MDDQQRRHEADQSSRGTADGGFPKPGDDSAMDPVIHQTTTRGDATTGVENEIAGVGVHGAEEGEQDRPQPGSEAQQLARESGARAFPESEDSDYLERD